MLIALYILAACVGLLIGFSILFAIRLHVAEDTVQGHTQLIFENAVKRDELNDVVVLLQQHIATLDGRADNHKQAIEDLARMVGKLDRAGHRHPEQARK